MNDAPRERPGAAAVPVARPASAAGSRTAPATRSTRRALLLSFALPGLGEFYLGGRRASLVRAVPVLAAAAWLLVLASGGLTRLAFQLLDATVAALLLALIVATGLVRAVSLLDTARLGRRAGGGLPTNLVAGLLVISIVAHGVAGWFAASFWAAGAEIFQAPVTAAGSPAPQVTFQPDTTLEPPASLESDSTTDPLAGGLGPVAHTSTRINVLLLGADSGLGYTHALTDSQIVVSIDTAARTVVMTSVPRDVAEFPFYRGGTYKGKINSLMSTATANPTLYPEGGIATLAREIGFLLGLEINYYAFVNLAGFAKLIDAVGGIDVVNPRQISDAGYEFPDGKVGFFLKAGPQHLDSRSGLAFVRTRQGIDDDDYERAKRQQLVLQALRTRLTSSAMLPRLPSLLDALAKTIRTDFPVARANEMIALAEQIPDSAVQKFVLGPPYAVNPPMSTTGGVWILRLDMAAIRTWSIETFGADSLYARGDAASPGSPPG